jgi:hypothetical protein
MGLTISDKSPPLESLQSGESLITIPKSAIGFEQVL